MVAQGRREGRVSQRYRVQAQRISRRSAMIAWANAKNASMTGSGRSVFQTSFLNWLAPGVGPLHRPSLAGVDRRRLAPFGDLAGHAMLGKLRTGLAAVIAAVQMDRRLLG
jgi:hypothetical protein